jgi:hypothetical protein
MQNDVVKYCIIAAMAAAGLALLIAIQSANLLDIFVAGGFGAAVYFGVYTKLTGDPAAAASSAVVMAVVAGFIFVVALVLQNPLFMILNLIAAVSLGYAASQLRASTTKT